MNIDFYSYTNMGARDHNEDSYGVITSENRNVAVLCDGLGGHNCGEVASQSAVKNILEGIARLGELSVDNIYGVIHSTNNLLVNQQLSNPSLKGMRTTVVGCITEKNQIHYFNSGDSRFYLFSNGSLKCMTKDHSVSQMSVELGDMSFDEIRFDADRNRLLKVLGDEANSEVGTIYKPAPLNSGDAFLLCSDGFWEYVLEEEMEIDLSKSTTAKEWVDYMLVRLLLKFSDKNDNFTVIGGIVK